MKLFVFGDSYVDTGNYFTSPSYKLPYGITFPGKPSGRFSDGRVLTDYVASFLNIKSPRPYSLKKSSELQYGMNFAYGGTGVFHTLIDGPNMTVQIDTFEKLIQQNVYTKPDLQSSISLVSAAGNDYLKFFVKNGRSTKGVSKFTASLVKQLSLNLKRIQSLGINKIAIVLLEPIGCLPIATENTSYEKCNGTLNTVAMNHNHLLLQAVEELNKEIGKSVFVTLDLFNSFLSTIASMQRNHEANSTLMNPLQPCCVGVSSSYYCGSVDEKGAKKYSVCDKPGLSFYWNNFHPSQNGWHAVYKRVQSSLRKIEDKNL
ncbi:putative triacylglycerol lipase [Medicago truncatula]|nr:GDSL esterase/lipase At5g03610 [Medicago truncatula]RHN81381.1 putative triacylglycerol lipase [Medicago truncatula]